MRAVLVMLVASCVHSSETTCADGRICPGGEICDDVHGLCVTQDQIDHCRNVVDHTPCMTDRTIGQCDRGVCIPGCGDTELQAGETCDDGNFANHDGCSSICQLEIGNWREIPSPWLARAGHSAAYDLTRDRLVVFGGSTAQGTSGSEAGVSNDTWERDPSGGWKRADVPAPPPRRAAVMAYDRLRGVTVLFGGVGAQSNALGDTWEYDGTWTLRTPIASPPGRHLASMVYDTQRQRVVLFGGATGNLVAFGDMWEFDGSTWTQMPITNGPGPRFSCGSAYDEARDTFVVFSGSTFERDTWERASDGTWTNTIDLLGGPRPRALAAMTFDPIVQQVVLFGGDELVGGFNDFWRWDGATRTWVEITTPRAPASRRGHTLTAAPACASCVPNTPKLIIVAGAPEVATGTLDDVWQYQDDEWTLTPVRLTPPPRGSAPMVYDPLRDQLVMYGGLLLNNDIWMFDGSSWQGRPGIPTPGLRYNHSMAWDAARGRIVVFGGGQGGSLAPYGDTWQWNGALWTRLTIPGSPLRRAQAAMAGTASGLIVMFGGNVDASPGSAPLLETWELDNLTWTQVQTAEQPGPTIGAAMAHDPGLDRLVLFDGNGATWSYRDRTWTLLVPAGEQTPVGRIYATLYYDTSRSRMVLYGGTVAGGATTDLWELVEDGWSRVEYGGAPPQASYSSVAYHPPSRTLVLFGGSGPTSFLEQTWAFRYESSTPDESCVDVGDEDGDGLVDCDDPDCALACP